MTGSLYLCKDNVQFSAAGMAGEHVDSSLDLSHLTEEEQSSILQVLQRDLELRHRDQGRIRSGRGDYLLPSGTKSNHLIDVTISK